MNIKHACVGEEQRGVLFQAGLSLYFLNVPQREQEEEGPHNSECHSSFQCCTSFGFFLNISEGECFRHNVPEATYLVHMHFSYIFDTTPSYSGLSTFLDLFVWLPTP